MEKSKNNVSFTDFFILIYVPMSRTVQKKNQRRIAAVFYFDSLLFRWLSIQDKEFCSKAKIQIKNCIVCLYAKIIHPKISVEINAKSQFILHVIHSIWLLIKKFLFSFEFSIIKNKNFNHCTMFFCTKFLKF